MKTISFFVTMTMGFALGFSYSPPAFGVSADGPITTVNVPGSTAQANVLEILKFMNQMGETAKATDLNTALTSGKLHYGKNLKYSGTAVHGLTTAFLNIYFDERLVSPSLATSVLAPASSEALEEALRFFNVALHELIHYQDYEDSGIDGTISDEGRTYQRSNQLYTSFVRQIWEKYQELKAAGSPQQDLWLEMTYTYAKLVASELLDYSTEEFGEINDKYVPLPLHDGCVEQMDRKSFGNYLLLLENSLRNRNLTIEERLERFDNIARFYYGKGTKRCLYEKTVALPPPTSNMTYGYILPWLRQEVYKVDRFTKGRMIQVSKSGAEHEKIEIAFAAVHNDIEELHLKQFGLVDFFEETDRTHYPENANSVYLLVSEIYSGQFPGGISFRAHEEWYVDGVLQRIPLTLQRVPVAEQAALGLFPAAGKDVFTQFTVDSPFDSESLEFQVTGIKFSARDGQGVRVGVPEFDQRMVGVYKVMQAADGTVELKSVGNAASNSEWNFRAEDAEYFVLVRRLYSHHKTSYFPVSLQISNHGVSNTPPSISSAAALSADDLKKLKAHPAAFHQFRSNLRQDGINVGWSARFSSQFSKAFSPFQVIDLKAFKGMHIYVRPTSMDQTDLTVFSQATGGGDMRFERTLNNEVKQDLTWFEDGREYFLVIEAMDSELRPTDTEVTVEYRTGDIGGPSLIQPELLSIAQVKERFGIQEAAGFDFSNEIITGAHPRDFMWKDSFYQLYEMNIATDIILEVSLPYTGIDRWFFFTSVNTAAWNANRPALEIFFQQRSSHTPNKQQVQVPKGRYFFAIATAYGAGPGDAPFSLRHVFASAPTGKVNLRKLNVGEMSDPRLQVMMP